jgi:ribosomal protein S18 acetylase RimI-like enzyme
MAAPMLLRPATPADIVPLADLGRRAFVAAFGHMYRPEDLATFLADNHSEAKVARELVDPNVAICLAERDGILLGFCKLALDSTLPRHSDALRPLELKQLYCDPDVLSQGMGGRLTDWVFEQARARAADAVELSVWSGNTRGQAFYARYGMAKVADFEFWVGTHCDHEFLFSVKLEGSAAVDTGV